MSYLMIKVLTIIIIRLIFAKASHIFFSKTICKLDIVLIRTVNILTTNKLVKLTMLSTTGPCILICFHTDD